MVKLVHQNKGGFPMEENKSTVTILDIQNESRPLSDIVIIEIVHAFKDIIIEWIDARYRFQKE